MDVARSHWSGMSCQPGANARMISGAAMTPMSVITNRTTAKVPATSSTSSRTSSCERLCLYSLITGTKAWLNDPSANRRRRKFGILKATSQASMKAPAPKAAAKTISRASPVTREIRVAKPVTAVLLKILPLNRLPLGQPPEK
jgi:hypothetical protein